MCDCDDNKCKPRPKNCPEKQKCCKIPKPPCPECPCEPCYDDCNPGNRNNCGWIRANCKRYEFNGCIEPSPITAVCLANVQRTLDKLCVFLTGQGDTINILLELAGEIECELIQLLMAVAFLEPDQRMCILKQLCCNLVQYTNIENSAGCDGLSYFVPNASQDDVVNLRIFPGRLAPVTYCLRRFGVSLAAFGMSQTILECFDYSGLVTYDSVAVSALDSDIAAIHAVIGALSSNKQQVQDAKCRLKTLDQLLSAEIKCETPVRAPRCTDAPVL